MKKLFSLIAIIIMSLTLVACQGKPVESDEVTVYFYEYRNSYKKDESRPDIIAQSTHKKGELLEKPEDPVRNGYIFDGWYKEVSKKTKWNFDVDILEKNTILYANWAPGIYKINLELNGGEFPENSKYDGEEEDGNFYYLYESGKSQTLHKPTKKGYKFLGWFRSETYKKGDRQEVSVDKTISEETTYYAHWELLRINITFDLNTQNETNPTRVATKTYDYGQIIDFPELIDVTGEYIFVGWNTRKDGSGDELINGQPFERELSTKVYAQWEPK